MPQCSSECSLAVDEDPDLGQCLKAMKLAVIAFSAKPQGITVTLDIRSSEVCRLFNTNKKEIMQVLQLQVLACLLDVLGQPLSTKMPLLSEMGRYIQLRLWGWAPYVRTASSTTAFPIHNEMQPQAWQPECSTSSSIQDCSYTT